MNASLRTTSSDRRRKIAMTKRWNQRQRTCIGVITVIGFDLPSKWTGLMLILGLQRGRRRDERPESLWEGLQPRCSSRPAIGAEAPPTVIPEFRASARHSRASPGRVAQREIPREIPVHHELPLALRLALHHRHED